MSAAPTPPPQRSSIRPFKFGWQTGTFRRGLWLASWVGWTIYFLLPLLSGWFLKLAFDALATDQSVTGLLVSIGVVEVVIGNWVWVDIETTGLGENADLLEIAAIITAPNLDEVTELAA